MVDDSHVTAEMAPDWSNVCTTLELDIKGRFMRTFKFQRKRLIGLSCNDLIIRKSFNKPKVELKAFHIFFYTLGKYLQCTFDYVKNIVLSKKSDETFLFLQNSSIMKKLQLFFLTELKRANSSPIGFLFRITKLF